MSLKKLPVAFGAALAFVNAAGAAPSNVFEPRALAMGGAGVASGHSTEAAFMNPALLATGEDRFSLSVPVGARLGDPDELLDAIDDFSDADPMDALSTAIDAYIAAPGAGTAAAVEARGEDLIAHLQRMSGRTLQLEARAAAAVNVPGKRFGVSVFGNAYALGGAAALISNEDIAAIQDVIDSAAAQLPTGNPTDDFTSQIDARFAAVGEAGVSIATRLDALGGIAVGVTPKYMQVRSYDYSFEGGELDNADIELEEGERTDSGFNVDLGVAKEWDSGWGAGLAVRNLISREYRTVRNNTVKMEPHARLGIAHRGERLTLAADIDLTEQNAFGVDSTKSRYVGGGAEFDLFGMLQLRAGYRHNLSDLPPGRKAGVASAGLGLSVFGVRTDIAVASNRDEITGALQIAFRY